MALSTEYIAGFFDGEGTVRVNKQTGKRQRYELQVSIGNTFVAVLIQIQLRFGGGIYRNHKGVNKVVWKWFLGDQAAASFLRAVLPYLLEKREQAQMALDFIAIQRPHRGGPPLTPEEKALREGYYLALRESKRGVP